MAAGSGSKRTSGSVAKSASMKFRPPAETSRAAAKGTKPLAEAASVQLVLMMMVVHVSRKIMYGIEISHRIGIYLVGTIVLSVVGDFSGESNAFLADKENFFNVYMVKYGFGWTLLLLGMLVGVTSHTAGCGRASVLRNSLLRLAIIAAVWFLLIAIFSRVEEATGLCQNAKLRSKTVCKAEGFTWSGLDVSGHCFLLISCNLSILEEAKAYFGWEKIKGMIRTEGHRRLSTELPDTSNTEDISVLSGLSLHEFLHLRSNYSKFTVAVRGLFCLASVLVLVWDLMLFCTLIYFHMMVEKLIASCLAVLLWFILYRVILHQPWSPGLPGRNGPFQYVTFRGQKELKHRHHNSHSVRAAERNTRDDGIPKFMGMPLYGLEQKTKVLNKEGDGNGSSLKAK